MIHPKKRVLDGSKIVLDLSELFCSLSHTAKAKQDKNKYAAVSNCWGFVSGKNGVSIAMTKK